MSATTLAPHGMSSAPPTFNGDGMSDILWQNDNGRAGVWLMHGATPILETNIGANPDLLLH